MPDSKREQVLKALLAALGSTRPAGATLLRNAVLPGRIPAAGLMILRDGDPGEPAFLFSPPRWFYEHQAEIDVPVDGATPAARDAAFDLLLQAIGLALAADRTLGSLVDYALPEAPVPLDLPVEGAEAIKAASIGVVLPYDVGDPLAPAPAIDVPVDPVPVFVFGDSNSDPLYSPGGWVSRTLAALDGRFFTPPGGNMAAAGKAADFAVRQRPFLAALRPGAQGSWSITTATTTRRLRAPTPRRCSRPPRRSGTRSSGSSPAPGPRGRPVRPQPRRSLCVGPRYHTAFG
jgi:hypothetical protein